MQSVWNLGKIQHHSARKTAKGYGEKRDEEADG